MSEVLVGGGLALGAGTIAWFWYQQRARSLSVERLAEPFLQDEIEEDGVRPTGLAPRFRWVPFSLFAILGLALYSLAGWAPAFCAALVLACSVGTTLVFSSIIKRRAQRLETQLTEAIDLIVGALHAGAGTLDALDIAAREVREPLRSHLRDLVGSIRLGETPRGALEQLYHAVPLESFRLFSFTLSVHEETGGSLAPTLTTVARSVRDRIDLKRRINAETTQAQGSVFGIVAITYGIGLVTWRTHPDRMEAFIGSDIGIQIVAAAVILQALGLLWMTRLTKIKY